MARDTRRTLSETVADLVRRRRRVRQRHRDLDTSQDRAPLLSTGTIVIHEDVRSLEDQG